VIVLLEQSGVTLARLQALAARLAAALRPGDLVLLEGPLGAGKTTVVRMLAAALGVTDPVRSPSFTIANVYAGPVPVNHLDLYRLEAVLDEDALALEDYLRPDAVTLIEWPEAGEERLGPPAFRLRLAHEGLETRSLVLEAGEDAAARWAAAAGADQGGPRGAGRRG